MAFRLEDSAKQQSPEIYRYTKNRWGEDQTERYVRGMHDAMSSIGDRRWRSGAIPAAFEVTGFVLRYEHDFVYWRDLPGGDIGIVTILHERMHQSTRLRDDLPR